MTAMPYPARLAQPLVDRLVLLALEEDLGPAGDLTSQATLSPSATATATFSARDPGILCGIDLAASAFARIGHDTRFDTYLLDGAAMAPGDRIATVSGNARQIMAAERVALNFLCHLSGIATHTARFVNAVAGTGARITDTRKTLPGLRAVEKYAVKCGGGSNHRFGLDDAILIKDNHIAVAGGVAASIEAARAFAGHLVSIEIEVDHLDQLEEALSARATAVLLDNMDIRTLTKAVELTDGRAVLEASGNVDLDKVNAIARSGVDYISTSKITMAAPPLDIGLDIHIRT